MNVFTFQDYRALLHHLVEERKFLDPDFTYQQLAEVAGMQRAYLSKILSGKAQLSQDQLFLISRFFSWSKEESDYVTLLLEWNRCELPERQSVLQERIAALQTKRRARDPALLLAYAESLESQLVHQALRIPRFLEDPRLIPKTLRIDSSEWARAMDLLGRLGVIKRENERWRLEEAELLAFPDAALTGLAETKTRQRLLVEEKRTSFLRHLVLGEAGLTRLLAEIKSLGREEAQEDSASLVTLNIDLVDWS